MPALSKMRLLRQWAGLCDMTPDFSPIMGGTEVGGFYVDVGWGTYGFKAGPVSGEAMAECIATGRTPEIIAPSGSTGSARASWWARRARPRSATDDPRKAAGS